MKIAVVGGGVNGLSCAWVLQQNGHQVELFEAKQLMQQTSSASSKLLHGGLRYLEHGAFRLVRESLHERDRWFKIAPHLAKPLKIVIPIYQQTARPRWKYGFGLFLYKMLAGNSPYRKYQWLSANELIQRDPQLKIAGLKGGYEYTDGQMDDYQLGLWIADQARHSGAKIFEQTEVKYLADTGEVTLANGQTKQYDRLINVAGPWAEALCQRSHCVLPYQLDLVRGSHLVINRNCTNAKLLENPADKRLLFSLPWQGKTLVGTTEVRQKINDQVACSASEEKYLLTAYNQFHTESISPIDVLQRFSGLRPLLKSSTNPNRSTREYAIHRTNKLITVLGGKWTTSMALARMVSNKLN